MEEIKNKLNEISFLLKKETCENSHILRNYFSIPYNYYENIKIINSVNISGENIFIVPNYNKGNCIDDFVSKNPEYEYLLEDKRKIDILLEDSIISHWKEMDIFLKDDFQDNIFYLKRYFNGKYLKSN